MVTEVPSYFETSQSRLGAIRITREATLRISKGFLEQLGSGYSTDPTVGNMLKELGISYE